MIMFIFYCFSCNMISIKYMRAAFILMTICGETVNLNSLKLLLGLPLCRFGFLQYDK